MKYFYVKKIEELISEEELPAAILPFGMERKKEINSISNVKRKLESTAVTILLHNLLEDYGFKKDELIKDEKGAPKLKNQKEIFCSLSHSKEYVCCAISDEPIGVDIQEMKEGKCEGISRRFFHEKEQKLYKQNPTLETFYKIWTTKESYLKMLGCGLPGKMNSFYLDINENIIYSNEGRQLANVIFESHKPYLLCVTSDKKIGK